MKLLQINSVANIGSTGRIAEQIGQAAMAAGWESYIAYGREAGQSQSHLIKIGSPFDVMWHGIATRLFDRHGLASKRATRRFISQIKEIQPDIIHLHNIHGYYLNYEVLFEYLSKADIPVVWTLHDCWAMTGHCSHFVKAECLRWKDQCKDCPLLQDYPKSYSGGVERNYNRKRKSFDIDNLHIVSVSKWLNSIVDESYLSKRDKHIIYNGVDIEIFRPNGNIKKDIGLGDKKILLGVATTWNDSKGLTDYYKLSEILSEEYQIVLIGVTRNQIQKLPKGIIGIERTNNINELVQYYSAADVVMNLSYAETFGLTTVEGFACGTPSIVYDTTASPELITENTGIVGPLGDILAVKDAVEEICRKGKEHYSQFCRERALKHFNKEDKFKEYIELYKKILKQ